MTNIEKVKRILDAGHWVKVTFEDGETTTITSCLGDEYTWIDDNDVWVGDIIAEWSTIEVIQRIPTAYKDWDKVLVLSNPEPSISSMQDMVWKVCEVKTTDGFNYSVWYENKNNDWIFPSHCLAPAFDEEPTLSGKEAKIVIDGKEYSVTLKLI